MSNESNVPALYAALARAIAKSAAVGKDAQNSFHKYKYASAESLIEEARGALAAEGLAVIPAGWRLLPREQPVADPTDARRSDGGYFADVEVTYLVTHADGGSIPCVTSTPTIREKGRPEDKAVATALTYNLGYFLRSLLLLPRVEEGHEVDRRDDRGYEPRGGAAGKPPPAERKPATAFDYDGARKAMGAAKSIDDLRRFAATIPEEHRPPLRDDYERAAAAFLKAAKPAEKAA
jgi:hypothetical protein